MRQEQNEMLYHGGNCILFAGGGGGGPIIPKYMRILCFIAWHRSLCCYQTRMGYQVAGELGCAANLYRNNLFSACAQHEHRRDADHTDLWAARVQVPPPQMSSSSHFSVRYTPKWRKMMKKVPGSVNICNILGFLISNTLTCPMVRISRRFWKTAPLFSNIGSVGHKKPLRKAMARKGTV